MREKFPEDDKIAYLKKGAGHQKTNESNSGIKNPLGIPTEREMSIVKKGFAGVSNIVQKERNSFPYMRSQNSLCISRKRDGWINCLLLCQLTA